MGILAFDVKGVIYGPLITVFAFVFFKKKESVTSEN